MKLSYLNDGFFSRLETLALNLKTNLSGYFGGKHLVSTYGQTVEFSDFREYQPGDDIRRIDWNLYSRFEKYFLKLFTDERQMQVQIFIDCSASMGKDNPKKAAYVVATAAALGFLAVQNMDKASFYLMKGDNAENENGTIVGKNAFFRAVKTLENIDFEGETDIEKCVTNCRDSFRFFHGQQLEKSGGLSRVQKAAGAAGAGAYAGRNQSRVRRACESARFRSGGRFRRKELESKNYARHAASVRRGAGRIPRGSEIFLLETRRGFRFGEYGNAD